MGLTSWVFGVEIRPAADGWRLALVSRERRELGPFATETEARHAEHRTLGRWNARARQVGGYAQRSGAGRWVVCLPDGVAVRGGRLLAEVAAPCTRAG